LFEWLPSWSNCCTVIFAISRIMCDSPCDQAKVIAICLLCSINSHQDWTFLFEWISPTQSSLQSGWDIIFWVA
jgi:hypothetical protein